MKTKKTLACLLLVITLCSFLSFNTLAQDIKPVQIKHEPITQQLITMVEHNSEIKSMLIDSIEKARKINPDKVTNPAQTLEEYYIFVDWASEPAGGLGKGLPATSTCRAPPARGQGGTRCTSGPPACWPQAPRWGGTSSHAPCGHTHW